MNSEPAGAPTSSRNLHVARHEDVRLIQENSTLLGVAFVAVVLLGPLFTAGYAVGRLTTPRGSSETASAREPQIKRVVANSSSREPAAHTTGGARDMKESAPPASDDQPAAGRVYLQLLATAKPQAIIDRLRRNGFAAFASEIPEEPSLHRVVIGPLRAGEVSKMRAELQSKGFPGESLIRSRFSIKRTF